ncbi:2Fe-2S iron-sulfur cluster-binding protein [Paraburkholderia adhaesiva]|uniref:2Fe-2S iron-sulfur cluster-binding protein n=1 Tax=Paraburkholderia adhaesiva TaxID=2883244 RepID=UPI001F42A26F|nr:2Fe-2S iron-sulfur cluster-binding protein [Paraburkholderia adhaesiva]
MVQITLLLRDGDRRSVTAKDGQSLMEAIRDGGGHELLALCGGCCSCGTCHVYVEERRVSEMPEMAEYEDDLLECSAHRRHNSRLSCQVVLGDRMDGMLVQIAPED